jgi:hypothetical protein
MAHQIFENRSVFISSTFRDMQGERDLIREVVLTELSSYSEKYAVDIGFVDLRWGVKTSNIESEEEKEKRVLKVCLDTIDETRPFMIVLLGDRYGWTPSEKLLLYATKEKGFNILEAKSVTALEIEYALTSENRDKMRHCFFYFRDELPYERMSETNRKIYTDIYSSLENFQLLKKLKQKLAREYPGKIRHYSVNWDEEKKRITNFGELDKLIIEDLKSAIDYEIANRPSIEISQKQLYEIETYFEKKRRGFFGREKELTIMKDFALNNSGLLTLVGKSGIGKSAIMAELYKNLQNEDVLVLPFCCGMSSSLARPEDLLILWIKLLSEIIEDKAVPLRLKEDKKSFIELTNTLEGLLFRFAEHKKIILMIDAADQFGMDIISKNMSYLPIALPLNVTVLVSLTHGVQEEELVSRGSQFLHLKELNESEIRGIVSLAFSLNYKEIGISVLNAVASKSNAGNPIVLSAIVQSLLTMDENDFDEANQKYEGMESDIILDRMLIDVIEDIPTDIEAIYPKLLLKLFARVGKEKAEIVLGLLANSEYGLRLSDVDAMFESQGIPFTNADFYFIVRRFRNQFIQDSHQAWRFHHNFVQNSIRTVIDRFLPLKLLADNATATDANDRFGLNGALSHLFLTKRIEDANTLIHRIINKNSKNINLLVRDMVNKILDTVHAENAVIFFSGIYQLQHFEKDVCILPFFTKVLERLREQVSPDFLKRIVHLLENANKIEQFIRIEDMLVAQYLTERAKVASYIGDINMACNISEFSLTMAKKIFGNIYFPIVCSQPLEKQFGQIYLSYRSDMNHLDFEVMQRMLLEINYILMVYAEYYSLRCKQLGISCFDKLSNYDHVFFLTQSSNASDDSTYFIIMKYRLGMMNTILSALLEENSADTLRIFSHVEGWKDFMEMQQPMDDEFIKQSLGDLFHIGAKASVQRGNESKADETYQKSIHYYMELYRIQSSMNSLNRLFETVLEYASFLKETGNNNGKKNLFKIINPYLIILENRYQTNKANCKLLIKIKGIFSN